jgi:hypothetical protein
MNLCLVLRASSILMATVCGLLAGDPFYPDVVDRCLNGPTVKEHVTVLADQNPVYLRGDFDGDGLPDYALQVKSKKTKRNGVLICSGSGGQPCSARRRLQHARFRACRTITSLLPTGPSIAKRKRLSSRSIPTMFQIPFPIRRAK